MTQKHPEQWRKELSLDDLERKYFLPRGLLTAVLTQESAGDSNAHSGVGASGLFQFMPKTADIYNVDPLNPHSAAEGAAKMYADLSKQYDGDLDKMLAGYNWGSGNLAKHHNDVSEAPPETKDYIKKIRGVMSGNASVKGDYKLAAKYARGTDSIAMNQYADDIESETSPEKAKEKNNSFLQNMMAENPVVGLFMLIFGMMSGMIGGEQAFGLFNSFGEKSEEEKKKAIDALPEGYRQEFERRSKDIPFGVGHASALKDVKQLSTNEIEDISNHLTLQTVGERTAELATKLVGQKEKGDNCGSIVAVTDGANGQPWCASFANYVFDKTMPDVYDQKNFPSAISFKEQGERYGAFHKKSELYQPEIGDAIVFTRQGGNHVGIITGYDETTHQVTYVAGNDGNAVRERTFSLDKKPESLLGFTSSSEVAAAKGVSKDHVEQSATKSAPKPDVKPVSVAVTTKETLEPAQREKMAEVMAKNDNKSSRTFDYLNKEDDFAKFSVLGNLGKPPFPTKSSSYQLS